MVLSLPALVVPFLDFHCGVSPMEAAAAALLAALTTPFLANAALCLHGFYDDSPPSGYYVSAYLFLLWSAELTVEALRLMRGGWRSWRENWGTRIRT